MGRRFNEYIIKFCKHICTRRTMSYQNVVTTSAPDVIPMKRWTNVELTFFSLINEKHVYEVERPYAIS